MKNNLRAISLGILDQWEKSKAPIDHILDRHLREKPFLTDPRDRRLVMALVFGVIRWRRYLDQVLAEHSSHPLARMKTLTLLTLRLGLYQLLFMNRVPSAAAVNETVEAFKAARQPKWLVGFVNGLLRSLARLPALPSPEEATMPPAVRCSHPDWLFDRWLRRYGPHDAEKICRGNNRPAPLCLRVNTVSIPVRGYLEMLEENRIKAEPGLFAPEAVLLADPVSVPELPGYDQGYFQVQDEAAQLVSCLLSPLREGTMYLDACAGLGGKTSHLAQMLPAGSRIVAVEPDKGRSDLLAANLARLGLAGQVAIVRDALQSLRQTHPGRFAGALVDAPCSGLGVIRRHPDIRWNRSESDLGRYQEIQLDLLDETAGLLAPEGILVYATCSMEPEENDQVVHKFLAAHPDFSMETVSGHLPAAAATLADGTFFRVTANLRGLDGFFAARMRKK